MADDAPERADRRRGSAPRKRPAQREGTAPAKDSAPRAEGPRKGPAQRGWQVALEAARQLQQLTGNEVEGITGMHRTDAGWRVEIDVLELRRVPTTTDVIATYEVDVDGDGELAGYRRRHRFVRGEVNDER